MATLRTTVKDIKSYSLIHIGVATKTMKGQSESGDRYLIKSVLPGTLVAVVDGLGHGDEAADASKRALATIEAYANESIITMLRRCNDHLKATRGVVGNVAVFNGRDETMTWLGVGNVEGVLYRADRDTTPSQETILVRGGVIGYQLPQLRASVVPISVGDTLVFATDGIDPAFIEEVNLSDSPQQIADTICEQYGKDTDDALVLVARYVGKNKP